MGKIKVILSLLIATALTTALLPLIAHANESDRVVVGDPRTVGISDPYGGVGCGGALIAPRVVYTSAHCVARRLKANMNASTWGKPITSGRIPAEIEDLYVFYPGIDVKSEPNKKVKVIAQFAPPEYKDSCEVRNCHPSLYDFAVLILEKEIPTTGFRVATRDEVTQWVANNEKVFGIGYGWRQWQGNQDQPGLYFATLRNLENKVQDFSDLNDPTNPYMHIQGKCVQLTVPCAGMISGSPLWIEKNGESIYIGAASAVSGPFARIAPDNWLWTHPFWRVNTQVEYYTAQAFPAVIDSANKFLAELVTTEKAAATSSRPVATIKPKPTKSIVCDKGKTKIKVTAKNPKCPAGYKKK